MKTINPIFKIVTLRSVTILLMCFIFNESFGQNRYKTEPMSVKPRPSKVNIGFSASGNYTSASGISNRIGFSPSGFIQYNFNNWGVALEGGSFKSELDFNSDDYLTKISSFTTVNESKNTIESVFIFVGPSYVRRFDKSFISFNILGGITLNDMHRLDAHDNETAQISYLKTSSGANSQQQDKRLNIFSGKFVVRYTYMVSNTIGLHINTQLLQQFSNKESYITYHDLSNVNLNSPEARYEVQNSPIIQEKIGLPKTTVMIGGGVSFMLCCKGGIKDRDIDDTWSL